MHIEYKLIPLFEVNFIFKEVKGIFTFMKGFFFFLILYTSLFSHQTFAQKGRSTYSYKYKPVKMSKKKARVACPIFKKDKYSYHSLGLKFGDPVTITYKYYRPNNFAIAIDVGSITSGLYTKHHRENFEKRAPDSVSANPSARYFRHKVLSEYAVEVKLLYQMNAEKLFPNLKSYIGAGWQLRKTDIEYLYSYQTLVKKDKSAEFESNEITHGVVITTGLEYIYSTLPFGAFIEVSLFTDFSTNPGWTRFQGGIGVRYLF